MAKHLIYEETLNAVFVGGAANPINPDTGENWVDEAEAQAWIDNYPVPTPPFVLTLVAISAVNKDTTDDLPIQQPFNLVTLEEGTTVDINIEVQDGNGGLVTQYLDSEGVLQSIPNETFTLPIIGLFGSPMKVVDVEVSSGKAVVSVGFYTQGMWKVTDEHVNMHIEDKAKRFAFTGLEFKVKQAGV